MATDLRATGKEQTDSGLWASGALEQDPQVAMRNLQKGLTVDLIATSREHFETCEHDEALPVVVRRNKSNLFDFLPVVHGRSAKSSKLGTVVGLVEIAPFRQSEVPDQPVHHSMAPLSDRNLIGADASILDFIRDADQQRCRLIVSGLEISGLVSLSDLQRLPVRATLFGLVTHLEIIMSATIRSEFRGSNDPDGWLGRLSPERRKKIEREIREATTEQSLVDSLLFTQFGDKETIIRKSPFFKLNKRAFKNELAQIQTLRNALAHANDYASSQEAARQTCRTVRLIEAWSATLATWSRASIDS
jgi:hypothetical protein